MFGCRWILLCACFLFTRCAYQPALSSSEDPLPRPQVPEAIEPFYEGVELWKWFEYNSSGDATFDRNAARGMIARNHDYLLGDYRLLALYMRASLLDLMSNRYLLNTIENFQYDFATGLQRWASHAMMNSEVSSQFASYAGGDPWGGRRGAPARKELLPSEMWGLSVYSGRIMGKPLSLATFLLSVVRMYGASAQNALLLENGMRTIGVFHTYPQVYLIDGTSISRIDFANRRRLKKSYFGLANDRYYYSGIFSLDSTVIDAQHSLLEQVREITGIRPFKLDSPYVVDYISRSDLPLRFGTISDPELGYALHSLLVPDRGLYLDVSADGPLVRTFTNRFDTVEQILEWMKGNLRLGSVYHNYQERVMIADQVLVYRFGTRKDQAMLLASFLIQKGLEPRIRITAGDAYVSAAGSTYELSSYSRVDGIEDSVLVEMVR